MIYKPKFLPELRAFLKHAGQPARVVPLGA